MKREGMSRAERIRRHPRFKQYIGEIAVLEKERIYCGHGLTHLLDTARIAYILNLEEGSGLPQEWIYAAALLHDIGKGEEYKQNGAHDEIGAEIAETVLADCGFTAEEVLLIAQAVRNHRTKGGAAESHSLSDCIRRADKLSRQCYACTVADTCKWPDEKKNFAIII